MKAERPTLPLVIPSRLPGTYLGTPAGPAAGTGILNRAAAIEDIVAKAKALAANPVKQYVPENPASSTDAMFRLALGPVSVTKPADMANKVLGPLARRLLGVNTGQDETTHVVVFPSKFVTDDSRWNSTPEHPHLSVFDRAGYRVMSMAVTAHGFSTLKVDFLKASHGRNVDDFDWDNHQGRPGRGNGRLVAEMFQGLVDSALENGFHRIICVAGYSDDVAKLYGKAGFLGPDGGEPHGGEKAQDELLTLDLTDPASVEKMRRFTEFSIAHFKDVPKNVSEKAAAKRDLTRAPSWEHSYEQIRTRSELDRTPMNFVVTLDGVGGP